MKDSTARANYICRVVGRLPEGPVLDLGCCQGNIGMRVFIKNEIIESTFVLGIDFEVREKYLNLGCEMIKGDLEDVRCFDRLPDFTGLIATEILEHITQPAEDRIINFINKKVSEYFIITFPAKVKMKNGHIRQPDLCRIITRLRWKEYFIGRTPTGSILIYGRRKWHTL